MVRRTDPLWPQQVLWLRSPQGIDGFIASLNHRLLSRLSHFQTLCEIFFETESGSKLDIHSNQELALYAHAKGDEEGMKAIQTGISLDVGDVTTTASAFVHGSLVSERVLRLGGRDVTNYLRELLNNGSLNQEPRSQGASIETQDWKPFYVYCVEILYKLKEEHCYVATPNFEAASQRRDKDSSLAVDAGFGSYGQRVNFAVERFTCPEILFKPHMIGRDCGGSIVSYFLLPSSHFSHDSSIPHLGSAL